MENETIEERVRTLTEGYASDFLRLWSRNRLGNAAGLTAHVDDRVESVQSLHEVDVHELDVEYLAVPLPETFRFLPVEDEALVDGPIGLMFCDVHERVGGEFLTLTEGGLVKDTADVMGGVTGMGVEFLYGEGTTNRTVPSGWGFDVPVYRDYMTPSIPDLTLDALLNFGGSRNPSEPDGWKQTSPNSLRPTLKSTL